MQDPIAVIVRFDGDPDDLIERFERARQLWIETQDADYSRPLFYAACKRREHPREVRGHVRLTPGSSSSIKPRRGAFDPRRLRCKWRTSAV